MADYTQTPQRPNIKPTGLPPSAPVADKPIRPSSGLVPALGAVAVVGIVALVAWGVIDNDTDADGSAAPVVVQMAPAPDAAATPDATPVAPTPAPMEAPDVTPLEVPTPAPEVVPAPAPTPAPTN